jgi:hypothetical protein
MDNQIVTIFAMVCAAIAIVSTVFHYVFKWKELKTLREIRDEVAKNRPGR